jgi:hypothetical protein
MCWILIHSCINVLYLDTARCLRSNLHTVHTFVKYIGCFQDTLHQDPEHLYHYSTYKCQYFYYLTVLLHVSCVQTCLIWIYAVLIRFYSMIIVPCGSKHIGMFTLILKCKYLKDNFVHYFGLVSWNWLFISISKVKMAGNPEGIS